MADFGGTWSTITLDGKQADIYEPARMATPPRVVIHLHGHGLTTLKDNPIYSAELDRHNMAVICPHGQRSWWTEVVCEEFDPEISPMQYLLESVVPFIQQRWQVEPPHIPLMGISMGGQGVLQLAYRHPRKFPVVAAIAPAVDFQNWYGLGLPLDTMFRNREAARQATAILYAHPLNYPRHQLLVCDPADSEWFESADRLAMKLSSTGIPFEFDFTTTRGGHNWDYFNLMAAPVLSFLATHLDKVRTQG